MSAFLIVCVCVHVYIGKEEKEEMFEVHHAYYKLSEKLLTLLTSVNLKLFKMK